MRDDSVFVDEADWFVKNIRSFVMRDDLIRQRIIQYIRELTFDQICEVVIRFYDPKRSLEQNSLAWVINTAIAEQLKPEGQSFTKDTWWLYLKREHFGPQIITLPDGSFIEGETKSSDKGKRSFSEFVEFLHWYAAEHQVQLPSESVELHFQKGRAYG